jgi:isocitrate dehydrogenase
MNTIRPGYHTNNIFFIVEKSLCRFIAAGLVPDGNLSHLISDAATMQVIRWTKGGFGMTAHNYDGDILTDEISQVHRSPGFITSNLIGKADDGNVIKGRFLKIIF